MKGGRDIEMCLAPRRLAAVAVVYLHHNNRSLRWGRETLAGLFEVMIERNFSSAHQLRGYKGKCENLHGHNYKIEIYARGNELDNIGLLVDFGELKEAADEVVAYLDHRNINELPPFDEELNPSAENLARYILERVSSRVGDERVRIYKVRCFETPTSVATYQVE
jgi:6-pyruvoyltetrahydropterin/6-carboxytetrahydropterin synthase